MYKQFLRFFFEKRTKVEQYLEGCYTHRKEDLWYVLELAEYANGDTSLQRMDLRAISVLTYLLKICRDGSSRSAWSELSFDR